MEPRFGRLRQLLHQGQFVGRIAPCRRFLVRNRVSSKGRVFGVSSGSNVLVKRRFTLIDGDQDERGQRKIPRDFKTISRTNASSTARPYGLKRESRKSSGSPPDAETWFASGSRSDQSPEKHFDGSLSVE
jgi:hypothetical protein